MFEWDDDDRAYNASVETEDSPGWYLEWEGPDIAEGWVEFIEKWVEFNA